MYGFIDKKVEDKGFGFIKTEEGQSYFFHFSKMDGGIDGFEDAQEGDKVYFDVITVERNGQEQEQAVQVSIVSDDAEEEYAE